MARAPMTMADKLSSNASLKFVEIKKTRSSIAAALDAHTTVPPTIPSVQPAYNISSR